MSRQPLGLFIEVDGVKAWPDQVSTMSEQGMFRFTFPHRLPKGLGRRSETPRNLRIMCVSGKVLDWRVEVVAASRNTVSATLRRLGSIDDEVKS